MSARLAYALEDAVVRALERRSERAARRRARRLAVDRAYLRGRGCHCDPRLPVHLVHSEGLREGCDVVIDYGSNVEHPERRQLPVDALAHVGREVRAGDAVHVKTDLLEQFVSLVLPSITEPFVLVTGDSDASGVGAFERLLDHARVAHWFAQNCDVAYRHPRLTRLPIGIDNPVYTKADKRLGFLVTMLLGRTPWDRSVSRNDMGDQALLQRVRQGRRRAIDEKPARVLCTFHQNGKLLPNLGAVPARRAAYAALIDSPHCHFVPRRLRQDACWALHDEFAFEAAPRGNGSDTFRVWECLALETIPVVQASGLDPLYEDEELPVAVVDSYRAVTGPALAAWKRELGARFTAALPRRLSNEHWLEKIRRAQAGIRTRPAGAE